LGDGCIEFASALTFAPKVELIDKSTGLRGLTGRGGWRPLYPDSHLNRAYNYFVSRFGPLNGRENVEGFAGDPDHPLPLSLEESNPEAKRATKTPIFNRRTLERYRQVDRVETASEALLVSSTKPEESVGHALNRSPGGARLISGTNSGHWFTGIPRAENGRPPTDTQR
jgi:hypothetical protein